jgi:hypothetical protein
LVVVVEGGRESGVWIGFVIVVAVRLGAKRG